MSQTALILLSITFSLLLLPPLTTAAPRKLILVQPPSLLLHYHNGLLLKGNLTLNLLWYGTFAPSQHAIVSDFIRSLTPAAALPAPSTASWWHTTERYTGASTHLSLGRQLLDDHYSLGKALTDSDIFTLAAKATTGANIIAIVLTAADVTVTGFCSSRCGTHSRLRTGVPYLWVGNSAIQCPGQCAWPFHEPIYGPQGPPLVAPNNDVGADGMIVNLATVLAGAVTNPDGRGYFQGPAEAPLEAVTACTGTFGKGAYPGYAGELILDPASGASYNAHGLDGRKYLLPAMWDPAKSQCSTLV